MGSKQLDYLTRAGIVVLLPAACVVGHHGWGDVRLGDLTGHACSSRTFGSIRTSRFLPRARPRDKLQELGDEAEAHLNYTTEARAKYANKQPASDQGCSTRGHGRPFRGKRCSALRLDLGQPRTANRCAIFFSERASASECSSTILKPATRSTTLLKTFPGSPRNTSSPFWSWPASVWSRKRNPRENLLGSPRKPAVSPCSVRPGDQASH